MAALAADGADNLKAALQIAYCHLLFNLTGILLFYPIPALRWPLTLCKILGTVHILRKLFYGVRGSEMTIFSEIYYY